ncbi:retinol-binding protein pinta [Malaya genurostris]|uniref:retinol-binding protein pinta n=1 Tax=Malaya genurostris TaxID=325434 RepID=UPI0026F3F09C|nr:retinol-binding protein pinta [Malaya genurostris]XP_058467875.1 retinol-binding protein pinta [Malaya genurostris]XP_058467877.1 retinol-binding protein pinta [Malaya genurostris]XP_058467878.1 retinol-binding protein pinta [Malaya genurostris]
MRIMTRLYVPSLNELCYNHAEEFLGETTVNRTNGLTEIERWLCNEQPHICMQNEARYIIYFLRTTKFDVEKAKRKIAMYHKIRADRVEWFQNRDPFLPELQELLDIGVFLPLRQKDAHNRQVVIIRTAAHNPKYHSQDNVFKVDKMILDLILHLDETISIYGIVAIFDMKNVTLSHALQLPPSLIKRTVESWENYPCRPQLLEFVNAPIHVNVVLNVFRSFMSTKMKSRVKISRRITHVSKVINLPPELGGSGDSYHDLTVYWKKQVQDHANWYAETEKFNLQS